MKARIGGRLGGGLVLALVATVVVGGGGCAHEPDSTADAAPAAAPAEHVTLDAEGIARAGIRMATVEPVAGAAAIAAFGRVLDPLPLVEALHARAAARATVALARTEHERVARLHRDDQNASTRDLEGARATLEKATLDVAAVEARLRLAWGPVADEDGLADDLVAGRVGLLRIDLPAGVALTALPATVSATSPARGYEARVLGRAPTTDPLVQGEGYLALVAGDPPRPGAVLAVAVPRPDAPAAGLAVPVSAVVWLAARSVVYVEPTDGQFERRAVVLGPQVGERWIVTTGLTVNERVVVAGAARLLSAEIVGAGTAAD